MQKGAQFFDDDEIFTAYQSVRHRTASPNETLEKPIILELIGGVAGKHVLDLGCGDGMFGVELLQAGCRSYLGLDSSQQMVQQAQQNLQGTAGQTIHSRIEDWRYPVETFDLIISRLALHYIANLDSTFANVYRALRQDAQFIFSVVHPVITSSDKSRGEGAQRQDWIVDDYFTRGPRQVYMMGQFVEQYHRTVEDLFIALQNTGFQVERLRESCPQRAHFADDTLYERRKRIPLFLFLSSRKRESDASGFV